MHLIVFQNCNVFLWCFWSPLLSVLSVFKVWNLSRHGTQAPSCISQEGREEGCVEAMLLHMVSLSNHSCEWVVFECWSVGWSIWQVCIRFLCVNSIEFPPCSPLSQINNVCAILRVLQTSYHSSESGIVLRCPLMFCSFSFQIEGVWLNEIV